VNFAAISEVEFNAVVEIARGVGLVQKVQDLWQRCARGQHTCNVLEALWERFVQCRTNHTTANERNRPSMSFLGYWINLIPSRASFDMPYTNALVVRDIDHRVELFEDEHLIWMMPHHIIYVSGLSFESDLRVTNRVQISASLDGASWELLWDSGTHAQFKTTIPCRSKEPARWFKLCVLKGEHRNSLNIHGILHDFVSGHAPYGVSASLNFHHLQPPACAACH